MKKVLIFLISVIFMLTFMFGCGKKEEPATDTTPVEEPVMEQVEDTTSVDQEMDTEEEEMEPEGETTEGQ